VCEKIPSKRYAKRPVVCHPSSQNFHPTGSNFKEIYHVYKVLQKQICDEHIFVHHAVTDSVITVHLSEICHPSIHCATSDDSHINMLFDFVLGM
jgi:hypothetical protein